MESLAGRDSLHALPALHGNESPPTQRNTTNPSPRFPQNNTETQRNSRYEEYEVRKGFRSYLVPRTSYRLFVCGDLLYSFRSESG